MLMKGDKVVKFIKKLVIFCSLRNKRYQLRYKRKGERRVGFWSQTIVSAIIGGIIGLLLNILWNIYAQMRGYTKIWIGIFG